MSAAQRQIEKAVAQIQHKEPVPDIDFTQHQLENGFTISTQERVVKDVRQRILAFLAPFTANGCYLGSNAGNDHTYRRTIFLA